MRSLLQILRFVPPLAARQFASTYVSPNLPCAWRFSTDASLVIESLHCSAAVRASGFASAVTDIAALHTSVCVWFFCPLTQTSIGLS